MLMDVTTDFGGYTPTDFSNLERGPVRVRNALQFSLNIPAVKALAITGESNVFERAQAFGMDFQRRRPTAGLSMALGTLEVHPLDLNRAYGTLANGGRDAGLTSILEVTAGGEEVLPPHEPADGEAAVSTQAAGIVTDILAGNTDPSVNPIWAEHAITDRRGRRRPAAFKTGTTNDAKDLNAYGYIAPPSQQGRRRGEYALSVGVWAGNSDSSAVTTVANPVFSLDVAAPIWDAFLSEVTRTWEIRDFRRPDGVSRARVDAFTGYAPSAWSRRQVDELFIRGTAPREDPYLHGVDVVRGADEAWYRWEDGCDGRRRTRGYLDLADAESDHPSWNEAVRGWVRRARRGAGVGANVDRGKRTFTAYFYSPGFQPYGQTWGGPFTPTRSCDAAPSASPSAEPSPSASPSLEPTTPPEPTEPPEDPTPEPEPTPEPTKKPKPTPEPTEEPTPEPDPTESPSPEPDEAAAAMAAEAEPASEEPSEAAPGG
jgi:membrane peptidoglycan carboxypeptidase